MCVVVLVEAERVVVVQPVAETNERCRALLTRYTFVSIHTHTCTHIHMQTYFHIHTYTHTSLHKRVINFRH